MVSMSLAMFTLALPGLFFLNPYPARLVSSQVHRQHTLTARSVPALPLPLFFSKESSAKTWWDIRDCLEDDDSDEVSSSRRRDERTCTLIPVEKASHALRHFNQHHVLKTFRPALTDLIYMFCTLII
jgi:hypothetical protein